MTEWQNPILELATYDPDAKDYGKRAGELRNQLAVHRVNWMTMDEAVRHIRNQAAVIAALKRCDLPVYEYEGDLSICVHCRAEDWGNIFVAHRPDCPAIAVRDALAALEANS